VSSALSWPVIRHAPLEDGLNIRPRLVRLRHCNSIKLCITLVAIRTFIIQNARFLQHKKSGKKCICVIDVLLT
jgi:hypothetical protein